MKRIYAIFGLLLLCWVFGSRQATAQLIARFEVVLDKNRIGLAIPVSVDLDKVTFKTDSLVLSEVKENERIPVPSQISSGAVRTLSWLVKAGAAKNRVYELSRGIKENFEEIKSRLENGTLTIHSGKRNFLQYWYKTIYPPVGVDSVFRRSVFIHPLWASHGQVLTNIQPTDHYHHYGIFNPWTPVLFEADTVDFWNLSKKQGTVRFVKFVGVNNGPVFSEFRALHEHVVFKKNPKSEKAAINELQTVRVNKLEVNQDKQYDFNS